MAFHHFPKKMESLQNIKKLLRPNGILIITDVIATSDFHKMFWNITEKVIGLRGYVEHYTKRDIEMLAKRADFIFSAEHIPHIPKRYVICTFKKLIKESP